ncbi:MAG TPA: hypothetical protein VJ486_12915 [Geothrix sp.]|nr:hypothetical protein [Geothrix sp.]
MLVLTLATLPLAAQSWEVGAFIGQQNYDKFSYADVTLGTVEAQPDRKTMGALRLGYHFLDAGSALLQVTAAYQFKSSSEVTFKVPSAGIGSLGIGVNLDHSAACLGVMVDFKTAVALGAGLDYRWDKLEGTFQGMSSSTTYGRPWARFNIGYVFPASGLHPFLGVETAVALSTKSVGMGGPSSDEEALKALAPKLQIGVYGGVRF